MAGRHAGEEGRGWHIRSTGLPSGGSGKKEPAPAEHEDDGARAVRAVWSGLAGRVE